MKFNMTYVTLGNLITAAALVWMTGCGGSSRPAESSGAPEEEYTPPVYTIGMSQCNLGEPWRVQMNADIKAAADEQEQLTVIFKDAQNDTLKQRAHIEEFVGAGVDLILVSPKEAQPLTEPVAKAFKAGIPVIVLDRALLGGDFNCFIGADNVKIGKAAGAWIAGQIEEDARIVELTAAPDQTSSPGTSTPPSTWPIMPRTGYW